MMIVRMGAKGTLYDLSDGSLSLDPVGILIPTEEEIYSAEALLEDIGELDPGFSITVTVTGFTDEDVKVLM